MVVRCRKRRKRELKVLFTREKRMHHARTMWRTALTPPSEGGKDQGGGRKKIPDTGLQRYFRGEGPGPPPPAKIFPYTFTQNFL